MSRTHPSRLRCQGGRWAAPALLAAVSIGVVVPGVAAGADDIPFSVAARTAPVAFEFADLGAPVIPGELLYLTPTFTRADLDSIGNSAGVASAPYVGQAVPAVMGAFNAVAPTGPILPEYPFTVQSQFPGRAEQSSQSGPFAVASSSAEQGTRADATAGVAHGNPGLASVSSHSVAQQGADGILSAVADSAINGLSLGPMLTIGHISGHVALRARPGGKPTKETSFSVGSLVVNGMIVGLTDKGLVPVPGTQPGADLNALTGQLAQAGITLALLPAEETDNAVDSAALAVGITRDVPNHGLVTVKVVLGRARAQVASGT